MCDMHQRHIAGLDLNLVKLLDALIDTGSVTLAAERLGIGQPAASRALARLREALGDPLLVRSQGGYRLTSRAERLRPDVAAALRSLDQVFAPVDFDPANATRRFRIAATDYGVLVVLNRAVPALLRNAPGTRLDVLPWTESTLDAMAEAEIDLALYADDPLPPAYAYRRLFAETYTCLYRRGHPIGQRACRGSAIARLKALGDYPRAVIAYPAGHLTQYDDLFAQLGLPDERVVLSLPYFLASPWIVAGSDLILVVPARVASCLASLAALDSVPFPMRSAGFEYRMLWHERMQHDLAHQWLRETTLKSLQKK